MNCSAWIVNVTSPVFTPGPHSTKKDFRVRMRKRVTSQPVVVTLFLMMVELRYECVTVKTSSEKVVVNTSIESCASEKVSRQLLMLYRTVPGPPVVSEEASMVKVSGGREGLGDKDGVNVGVTDGLDETVVVRVVVTDVVGETEVDTDTLFDTESLAEVVNV